MKIFIIIFIAFIVAACAGNTKNINLDNDNSLLPDSQKPNLYAMEKQKLLLDIMRTPPSPVMTPGAVMRVLFLPYVDENSVLSAPSYKFVKMDDGQWILGEYLLDGGKPLKELKPLEHVKPALKKEKKEDKEDKNESK